jgi:large subunit ribosomal protein L21
MFAVIKTGGNQYQVQAGDKIKVEKLEADEGEDVVFDQVLLVSDNEGEKTEIGTPFLEDHSVKAKVLDQDHHDKIRVTRFKRKNRYKKTKGHKQPYTEVEITELV